MIAILPLKANSERVKDKNIKELCGKPLFFYIINTLRKASSIKRVIINTDSNNISDMAKKEFGDFVEISPRPEELCGDFVSVNKIINYEVSRVSQSEDDLFIQTHSTNPLLSIETLENAITYFESCVKEGKHDSMFSVTEHRTRFYSSDLLPVNHNPKELIRTQDLEPLLEENSNFYIFTKKSFSTNLSRIGEAPYLWRMDNLESSDIDTENDWLLVETLLKRSLI